MIHLLQLIRKFGIHGAHDLTREVEVGDLSLLDFSLQNVD